MPPLRVRTAPLFVSASAGLAIFGITLAVLGTVFGLPAMRARMHLDLAQEGHIFLVLYLGVFLSNLFVGPIIDALGHKWVMVISSLLVGGALVAMAGVHTFSTAAISAFVLGFGGGGLCTTSNALVSDLYVDRRAAMLNVVGIFFGVGALCVPLLALGIEGRFEVEQLLWFAAALAVASAVYHSLLTFPPPHKHGGVSLWDTARVARFPGLIAIGFLLLVESGNEATIGGWTSTYAGSAGLSPHAATVVLACYWAAMIAGRALASRFVQRLGRPQTILLGALGAVIGCGVMLNVNSIGMLAFGAVIIGISFGPIFQTALGIAGDRYPVHSGSVFGLLFAFSLAGAMAWPWAVGQISHQYAVRYGMFVPLVGALCICLLGVNLLRSERVRACGSRAVAR